MRSHRLRTMRGLKSTLPRFSMISVRVASFAYDAWIEIRSAVTAAQKQEVASFAYDAWIEMLEIYRRNCDAESHRLRTMRGLKFR